MMTDQIRFSVLTAPLAAIDRRSLSQAWYSALHLAQETGHPIVALQRAKAKTAAPAPATSKSPQVEQTARPSLQRVRATRENVAPRADGSTDRRAVRSHLARRIEREFLHPLEPARRATFSIEGRGVRVHITMQGTGGQLRLVAVCPPRVRAIVAQAMNEARFALARRGIDLAHVLEESPSCK